MMSGQDFLPVLLASFDVQFGSVWVCNVVCSVSGWLQWPLQPHRRTSRCPRRRCRSWRPASCLHSEGALHTRPGLLGPLPHVREEEPGVPAGGTGCSVPALNPHQTGARPAPAPGGPMATQQAFSQGSGPGAGRDWVGWWGHAEGVLPWRHVSRHACHLAQPSTSRGWGSHEDLGTLVPVYVENLPSDWETAKCRRLQIGVLWSLEGLCLWVVWLVSPVLKLGLTPEMTNPDYD